MAAERHEWLQHRHAGVSPTVAPAVKQVASGRIEVFELGGAGPRLGYLHGPLGNPSAHSFLEALAEDHTVLAPCLPGFNGSDACPTRSFYDWVFLTSETVDVAGLTGAPVVAASVGAMLALEVAAIRPEAFERLVLVAPLGLWDPADPVHDLWSERTKYQPSYLLSDPGHASAFFDDPAGLDVDTLMEAELRRYRTRRSAASLMWPLPDHGLRERLHRVRCPVHLVWGGADRLSSQRYAERFAELLVSCTGITIVDGAGHLAEWDDPDGVAAAVRAALAAA